MPHSLRRSAALLFVATVICGTAAWSYLEGIAHARLRNSAALVAELRAFAEVACVR